MWMGDWLIPIFLKTVLIYWFFAPADLTYGLTRRATRGDGGNRGKALLTGGGRQEVLIKFPKLQDFSICTNILYKEFAKNILLIRSIFTCTVRKLEKNKRNLYSESIDWYKKYRVLFSVFTCYVIYFFFIFIFRL